jgi:hypothetical protein
MGRFHLEFANKCDVPAALHSPLKSARSMLSPARTRPSTARIDTEIGRGRGSFALSGSDQVGAALGYLGGAQSRARSAVRPRTSTDTVDRLAEERRGIFGERDYDASEGTTAGALHRPRRQALLFPAHSEPRADRPILGSGCAGLRQGGRLLPR